MEIFIVAPLVLISAFVLGELVRRFGIPAVVGQIIAGLVLGIPFVKQLVVDDVSLTIVDFLAELGIVFLLFLAGMEIDVAKVKETSKDSILISLSSALFPFVLGFSLIILAFPEYGFMTALVFGGTLMVTSEGTKVKVLMDLNSLNSRLGAVMLAAGAIDDVFEVLFLTIVVTTAHGGGLAGLAMIPVELLVFVAVAFVSFKIISKVLPYLDRQGDRDGTELFSMIMIFILVLVALSEVLQLGYLIGAILGGFLLQLSMKTLQRKHRKDIVRVTKLVALGFIVPFFFVNVGWNFDITVIFQAHSNLFLLIATVVIAFTGKIVGTLIVKPLSSLTLKQLYYVGWAMNSRGAAELVIALIAMQYGLIPLEVFSALVTMSVITTIAFPPVLARGIRKNPKLMNTTRGKK